MTELNSTIRGSDHRPLDLKTNRTPFVFTFLEDSSGAVLDKSYFVLFHPCQTDSASVVKYLQSLPDGNLVPNRMSETGKTVSDHKEAGAQGLPDSLDGRQLPERGVMPVFSFRTHTFRT